MSLGLLDGAIIIIDLILGVERAFLEKMPTQVVALSIWEDRVLIAGSLCGRINIYELEHEDQSSLGSSK